MLSRDGDVAHASHDRIVSANGAAAWDPHSLHNAAVGTGHMLYALDTRDMEVTHQLAHAHKGNIR